MGTYQNIFKKLLAEDIHYSEPPAIVQQIEANYEFSPKFISFIKRAENSILAGWNPRTQKWYPHKSAEGGADTIAYGHKLQPGEDFSQGLTEVEATDLLKKDLQIAYEKTKTWIDSEYGKGTFESLHPVFREILTDYTFNIGSISKFPKFTKALLTRDADTMLREYKRTYTDEHGKKHMLQGRNDLMYHTYLKHIAEMFRNKSSQK